MTYDDLMNLKARTTAIRKAARRSPETLAALDALEVEITSIANRICLERCDTMRSIRAIRNGLDSIAQRRQAE